MICWGKYGTMLETWMTVWSMSLNIGEFSVYQRVRLISKGYLSETQ